MSVNLIPAIILGVYLTVWTILSPRLYRRYKEAAAQGHDFYNAFNLAAKQVLGNKAGDFFSKEISMIFYSLLRWKKVPITESDYTYHKKSGITTIWVFILFLVIAETVAVHFLLGLWSPIAAWILTVLSIYGGVQILGISKSMKQRPIKVKDDHLYVRYGILKEATVPLTQIESFEKNTKPVEDAALEEYATLSPLYGMEGSNVRIAFREPVTLKMLYGKKEVPGVALYIDEVDDFVKTLDEQLAPQAEEA